MDPAAAPARPVRDDRTLLAVACLLSAGAGVVHVGLAADHAEHHLSMGAAFLAAGWAQLAWPALAWLRTRPQVLVLGAVLQLAAVAALALTTRVGWPLGATAGAPEPLTGAAVLCLALELGVLASLASLLLAPARLPRAVLPLALGAAVACSSTAVVVGSGHDVAPGTTLAAEHAAAHGGATAPEEHGAVPHESPAARAAQAVAESSPAPEPGAAAPQSHGHAPADTRPPTPEQQAAADALLAASRSTMRRYELASVAEAEGYRVVHDAEGRLLHYAHDGYRADGRTLDPSRIESLLYVVLPGGGRLLVGGMFMMPVGEHGPQVGGSLTPWHAHDDLCLDPTRGIAITQLPGGGCPAGSAVGTTGEMMHVWALDYPGGPFGELDPGALRTAVREHFGLGAQPG